MCVWWLGAQDFMGHLLHYERNGGMVVGAPGDDASSSTSSPPPVSPMSADGL